MFGHILPCNKITWKELSCCSARIESMAMNNCVTDCVCTSCVAGHHVQQVLHYCLPCENIEYQWLAGLDGSQSSKLVSQLSNSCNRLSKLTTHCLTPLLIVGQWHYGISQKRNLFHILPIVIVLARDAVSMCGTSTCGKRGMIESAVCALVVSTKQHRLSYRQRAAQCISREGLITSSHNLLHCLDNRSLAWLW